MDSFVATFVVRTALFLFSVFFNIQCHKIWTFFHQLLYIHDAVSITWEKKRSALFASLVEKDMGHCAKHGSYTVMKLDINKVLTVQLVQVGNSQKLS